MSPPEAQSPKPAAAAGSKFDRICRDMAGIVRLAVPITISRLGSVLLVVVDVAMLGHVGADQLAHYGLASAFIMVFFLIGVGMLIGVAVMTAQARGAGRERECGTILRVGLIHAVLMGSLFVLASYAAGPFFAGIGQMPELAAGGGRVAIAQASGLPGVFLFICCNVFLEALGRPRPGVVVMFAANFLNYGLNWLVLEGGWTLGTDAGVGVALATSATRWIAALVLIAYVLRLPDAQRYNLKGALEGAWRISARLRRLGYGFGMAQGLESLAFSTLSMLAGLLGANAVAGYQIALNLIAFVFMAAVGVATATGVAVGHAVGRRDRAAITRSGWSGVATIFIFMAVVCIVLAAMPEVLAGFFTNDAVVLSVAAPTIVIAGVMLLADGPQAVLMGALRGAGDVWAPTIMHLCAFLLVMTPAAWWLAIELNHGVPGLMIAACLGVCVAALLLGGRFLYLSKRPLSID